MFPLLYRFTGKRRCQHNYTYTTPDRSHDDIRGEHTLLETPRRPGDRWFQTHEKNSSSQIGSFPKAGVKNTKTFETHRGVLTRSHMIEKKGHQDWGTTRSVSTVLKKKGCTIYSGQWPRIAKTYRKNLKSLVMRLAKKTCLTCFFWFARSFFSKFLVKWDSIWPPKSPEIAQKCVFTSFKTFPVKIRKKIFKNWCSSFWQYLGFLWLLFSW